eukprot:scaffold3822_cov379-Prasinococcus_capsulatus_cf.AAC.7
MRAGAQNAEYGCYVTAHLQRLRYLDHRRVERGAVAAARERYQDELLELEEAEREQAARELAMHEQEARRQLLRAVSSCHSSAH